MKIVFACIVLALAAQMNVVAAAPQDSTKESRRVQATEGPSDQAAPAPIDSQLRKVGGSVSAPTLIYRVDPKFSKEAKKRKMEGVTTVQLIVDANGNPRNVHVVRSMAEKADEKHRSAALSLDQAAVDAVSQYRFAPAKEGSKPVPVVVNVEVNFRLF